MAKMWAGRTSGITDSIADDFNSSIRFDCKMYQQALNDIETAIDLAPGNVLYYLEKGMLCYRVKFTEEGIRTMQKACEIAPKAADTYYLLGRLYIQQGDKEKAKPALESAVELGHPDARAQLDDLK